VPFPFPPDSRAAPLSLLTAKPARTLPRPWCSLIAVDVKGGMGSGVEEGWLVGTPATSRRLLEISPMPGRHTLPATHNLEL